MKDDIAFQKKFFDFFENIIHHHLPDVDVQLDSDFEPRCERPPKPPVASENIPLEILEEWDSVFVTEIKKCGEVLQCHVHKPVCEKYGNQGKCCFLFPHEVVDASYFDPETNSVVLMCRDENVNYFNPYILVFCRHNHDIKCILSGKAAKSAMFYITDYITKMDIKTYEMLSLMSRAVSNMPVLENSEAKDHAKMLLHKCLAQFSRQQQIHAQQAARYLCGHGDGIPSHLTVPMLSSLLINHVHSLYSVGINNDGVNDCNDGDDDDDDTEHTTIRIAVTPEGKLQESNQIHDYYYRDEGLRHMNFYDFCRCVSLQSNNSKQPTNTPESQMDVLHRYAIVEPHPLAHTHHLIQHTNEKLGHGANEYVSRVIGTSIPRSNSGTKYKLFVLAHLKPFGFNNPLIPTSQHIDQVFQNFQFSPKGQQTMKNWDAIHECEDARDAERLCKRAVMTAESQAFSKALKNNDDIIDFDINTMRKNKSNKDFEISQWLLTLQQSKWFKCSDTHEQPVITPKLSQIFC
jgi:hypothetical protein